MRHPFFVSALLMLAIAGEAGTKPGELTVEPPTLHCAGFHWEISNDGNNNATANIEFRKTGADEWKKGLDFMRMSALGRQFVSGSLFDLEPGTKFEAKLTLADPDGVEGEATKTVTFTTRSKPIMPKGGATYHIYSDDYTGAMQQPLLAPDGNWREVIASAGAPVKPGDTILAHAGTYKVDFAEGETVPLDQLATAPKPTMPEGGTTWHVYPPKYKGKKEQPTFKGRWAYAFMSGEYDQLKPGDTILVHAGTYKIDKFNYRHPIFSAPRWGSWRIWNAGEPGKPIRLKAADDGDVVFDGNGSYLLFETIGSHDLWIDGITFRNTECAIIAGQKPYGSCENLTITNCTFEDVRMPLFCETEIKGPHLSENKGLDVIHTGPTEDVFGTWRFRLKGTAEKPIVFKAAGDGDVIFDGQDHYASFDVVEAAHLWFDGLQFRKSEAAILAGYQPFRSTTGLIVTNCRMEEVRNGIYDDEARDSRSYYIADNYFKGMTTGGMNDHRSPFGIFIAGRGHVVEHNHLEWFQDCISTGWDKVFDYETGDYTSSLDISNNVLLQGMDDFIEMDRGVFNIRAIRNLAINTGPPAFSMQGGPGAPYYWIRNIAVKQSSSAFKMPRNMIVLHNIITSPNAGHNKYADDLHYYNNVFLPFEGQFRKGDIGKALLIHLSAPAPQNSSDYNAYHMLPDIFAGKPFGVGRKETWATLEEYSAATGFAGHSIILQDGYGMYRNAPRPEKGKLLKPKDCDFGLKEGAPVIDKAKRLPNINDGFKGDGPDMGAIEFGDEMPHYGPRVGKR